MKTLKYSFIIFLAILCSYNSIAQISPYTADAVRYSQTDGGGTARFVALGGANVSLGGDISSISGNPAGLGFYNRSSWAISPVLRIGDFSAQYQGETNRNIGGNVQVPNMGMVFHNRFEEYAGSKWVSGTFGIAINQKQSFYNNINYSGTVEQNSNGIISDFVENTLQPFLTEDGFKEYATFRELENDVTAVRDYSYLAFETYLLGSFETPENKFFLDRYDYDEDTNGYLTESTRQRENVKSFSGLTTLDLSYGANYNDVLYLGASLNVTFLNYRQTRNFRETPSNDLLNYLELDEELNISGTGAAITVGGIYKPIDMVNLGFSYTSPTFISITEIQNISMETSFIFNPQNQDENVVYESEEIINEVPAYNFIIPQKISAGATLFLSKYGFATADIEYVDYESARFTSSNGAFGAESPEVGRDLENTFNVKAGLEGRLDMFRARVGYAYFDNPYQNRLEIKHNRESYSGGIGILKNGFFADLTYSLNRLNNDTYIPYGGANSVDLTSNISSFRLTLGKNF